MKYVLRPKSFRNVRSFVAFCWILWCFRICISMLRWTKVCWILLFSRNVLTVFCDNAVNKILLNFVVFSYCFIRVLGCCGEQNFVEFSCFCLFCFSQPQFWTQAHIVKGRNQWLQQRPRSMDQGQHASAQGAEPVVPTEAPHQGRQRGLAKFFLQRHRGPMRWWKFWQRHRGPMRLAKFPPPPLLVRARAGEGGFGSVREVQFLSFNAWNFSIFQILKFLRVTLMLHRTCPSVARKINAGIWVLSVVDFNRFASWSFIDEKKWCESPPECVRCCRTRHLVERRHVVICIFRPCRIFFARHLF